ncbi:MAG: hypothetical protein HKP37_02300, partial [Boseongicola sp.]|nr:hypothetical protein [Boseongicola sp.]
MALSTAAETSAIFDGLNAVAQAGMTMAVSLGVWVAYRQLHIWKEQDIVKKKADIAEELLAASMEISDKLRGLRTPFDDIPE